jgi:MFS family permease
LNKRAIILLFIANAISGVAQGISMIAIPWYFAQKEMLVFFGAVYLVTNICSMFWVPLSGAIIDKYDRKTVFLAVTFVGGSMITAISALGYTLGGLPDLLVALVFALTFLNYNIHYPNLYAFVQEITERKNYSMMTSLMEIIGQCTTITAGAVATLLLEGTTDGVFRVFGFGLDVGWDIAPWQIHQIFMIDAMTYFAAFGIISLIVYQPLTTRKIEVGSIFARLKTGFDYLKENKPIFWFGVLSYMVFLAMLLEAFYLGVSYVSNHLQESGDVYANSKMAYAAGAICVGLTLKNFFQRIPIPALTVFLTFLTAAVFFTQFASKSIPLFFFVLFVLGISNAGTRIARVTYLFRNVPNQVFGRAGSIFFLTNVFFRILMLGVFSVAFFQEGNNIIYAYLITSIMLVCAGILLLYHYRSFDLSKTA